MNRDARLTLARPDLASRALEGLVAASAYADPKPMRTAWPGAGIHARPDLASERQDHLLFGEVFDVLEVKDGFAWGQARRDGYVGFVDANALQAEVALPTHRVAAIRTYAFAEPSIKTKALGPYSLNSLLTVEAREGRFVKAVGSGWFVESHLSPVGVFEDDPAGVAERFLGAPYLWGGRESLGLDCSALVQQALMACGRGCPRDTDLQQALGREIDSADLARGDLVFWKGHVAMMLDEARIIHANAHHMCVAVEPLAEAIARITPNSGPPTAYRRP